MELKTNVRALTYAKRLLSGDTKNILPFPVRVQKPVPAQMPCVPLPRCAPEAADVPAAALDTFIRNLAAAPRADVHTVLVLRHGKVVCEGAFAPYSSQYWHVSHSLCKSVTGMAIGMLIDEGKLSLNESVCDIFPEKCSLLTSKRMRALTVKHLVTMRSGVTFREIGAVQQRDWTAAFLSADVMFEPGKKFNYNSMNSYMLSAIVTRKTNETLFQYLTQRLFVPLGFGSVAWETCPMGINKGGWGLYLMPEDLAKLAQLYLQRGVWKMPTTGEKKRLLSEEWIAAATQPDSVHKNGEEYGYQLWTHGADGSFMFNGMFGQYAVVSPALDMVVVVNAGSANLFTNGPSWAATQQLLAAVHQNGAAHVQRNKRANRALNDTLLHLRCGMPVPVATHRAAWRIALQKLFDARDARRCAATVAKKCAALTGRVYLFEKCKFGLLPMVIACMNDYYTKGLSRIAFAPRENGMTLLWTEGNMTQQIPIGFGTPLMGSVNFGGNVFVTGALGTFTADEDDCPVLKLTIHLVESSSTQHVKLFFLPDGTLRVELCETPSLLYVMELIQGTNPEFIGKEVTFLRDLDYISFQFNKMCNPTHIGVLQAADAEK